jgi:hypothetical protein
MPFAKDPEIDIPTQIEYLLDDATGEGVTLEQFCKSAVSEVNKKGRFGNLVDYPVKDGETVTLADVKRLNLQASFKEYTAENIINWATKKIGGKVVLSMVVLKEEYEKLVDEFSSECETQYRVLALDENDNYTVRIFRDGVQFGETLYPSDSFGQMKYIPFYFAGSVDNNSDVDIAPLESIADINIGHYRNSADHEEMLHLVGQVQPVVVGVDQAAVDANGGSFEYGSMRVWTLPADADAKLLQINESSAYSKEMERKEERAVTLGARLITQSGQAETAEAAKIKFAGDSASLVNVVQNVSQMAESSLATAARMMQVKDSDITYKINTEFYDKTASPEMITRMIMLEDRGTIAKSDTRSYLRQTGVIDGDRTDEDLNAESEKASPIA